MSNHDDHKTAPLAPGTTNCATDGTRVVMYWYHIRGWWSSKGGLLQLMYSSSTTTFGWNLKPRRRRGCLFCITAQKIKDRYLSNPQASGGWVKIMLIAQRSAHTYALTSTRRLPGIKIHVCRFNPMLPLQQLLTLLLPGA